MSLFNNIVEWKQLLRVEDRIYCKELVSKITTARDAARIVQDGMTLACSGFTSCGYPKTFPLALAERVREGEALKVALVTGASTGIELDEALCPRQVLSRGATPIRQAP